MAFAGGDKPRVEPRVRAMVRAAMRDSMGQRDVCIIDVSTRGLLATTARPPARGEFIEVQLGRHRLAGHVKWAGDRRFGLSLQERVSVAAVVEGGKGAIRLEKSVGVARRRQGMWHSLVANPQMLGRMAQLGIFLLVAGGAAFVIAEIAGSGFAPMQQAVMAMNAEG